MTVSFEGHLPQVHPTAKVAENATLVGSVTLGPNASVWYGAVIRGDEAPISIGENTNIQDNATVHASPNFPAHVGSNVTVGHNAVVHGCTVEDGCLIGMGAILLNGCVIGAGSMVAAGALVPQNKGIPPGSLGMGAPAKVVRTLEEADRSSVTFAASEYVRLSKQLEKSE